MEQPRSWFLHRIFNVDSSPIVIKEGLYKIGRSPDSNIFCKSEWVSRFHCEVTVKGGNIYIKDLGSFNGTYIDETKIMKERDLQLKNGDVIGLGKPFSGDMPVVGHYVYRVEECSSPTGPSKRKREDSICQHPQELPKRSISPKRKRPSIEKVEEKIDPLMTQKDLSVKQEVLLEKSVKQEVLLQKNVKQEVLLEKSVKQEVLLQKSVAECQNQKKDVSLNSSVGIDLVSSSNTDMECIDLTNDGSEKEFADKSASGQLRNKRTPSPDSSDQYPVSPDSNSNSVKTNKAFDAIMEFLKKTDSDEVLKKFGIYSKEVDNNVENVPNKSYVHDKSTIGKRPSNLKCEQIISSNISITIPDEDSNPDPSQSIELANKCLKQNNLKIEADVEESSIKSSNNRKYDSSLVNNQISHENKVKTEYEKGLCSSKPVLTQPPSDLTNVIASSIDRVDSSASPVLPDLKNLETGKNPIEEHNYRPQLKRLRSDSFTSELTRLEGLLNYLDDSKESNNLKPIKGENDICIEISEDEESSPKSDNIKGSRKSIDTTCRDNESSSKRNGDILMPYDIYVNEKTNPVINLEQLTTFNEKGLGDPINVNSHTKPISDGNEVITPAADNIKRFHKIMDSTCRQNESPSKNYVDTLMTCVPHVKEKTNEISEVITPKADDVFREKPVTNLEELTILDQNKVEVQMDSSSKINNFDSLPFPDEANLSFRIKEELLSQQNDPEERMVFSQDIDGVVVIDESEDELEYSQLFMEQDEITKEASNEKTNKCTEEEFLFEINEDDNEDLDMFQAHFSQCSQEQELVENETPKEKRAESPLQLDHGDLPSEQQAKAVKSPLSRGKDKKFLNVCVELKRLDMKVLEKTNENSEADVSEPNLQSVNQDDTSLIPAAGIIESNNKMINLDKHEKIKCKDKNVINMESGDLLKKKKSNKNHSKKIEKPELSPERSLNKTVQFTSKSESDTEPKAKKKISSRKSSIETNTVNTSYSKKANKEKSVNTFESNENCPPSNLIKIDTNKSEVSKQVQSKEIDTLSLPPPDSISGAKLVKSTLLSQPPTVVQKKRGRPRKAESSVTKEALNKKKQQEMIETRKARLKSLALEANSKMIDKGEKDNAHREVISKTTDKEDNLLVDKTGSPDKKNGNAVKSVTVAKVTEKNRSCMLIEGFLEDPCRKSRTRRKIEKANSTVIGTESIATATRSVSCEKLKESSVSKAGPVVSLPKGSSNGLRSCLKPVGQRSSIKKVDFNLKPDVKLFECEGILRSVNAMGLKDKAPTPIPKSPTSLPLPPITTLEETYFDIVHWNASWVNEIKVILGEPPVYVEKYNVKDSFVSYKDYKRWLYPLMMYELWGNMCRNMDDEDYKKTGRAFDGIVLQSLQYGIHTANGKNLLLLKCFFPLYGTQAQSMVEAMDILLIKALSLSGGKRIFFIMFGLVYSAIKINSYRDTCDPIARHYLTTLNRKPDACAYFDIIIYKSQKRQLTTGFQLRIRPTYNMMTELREFESLIKLASSPLSHIIIDPVTNNSVYLQKDMNNKLVSAYPLNEEQRKAILCTTQSVFANVPTISLIHGPPGTGKTQVIVSIVEQILFRFKSKSNYKRKKILVCSHSNNAIDEICLRLLDIRQQLTRDKRFKLTRFGRKDKMHPRVAEVETTALARKEVAKRNLNDEINLELSLQKATERMVANALENPESPKTEHYKRRYEHVQKRIACLEALVNNKDPNNETRLKEIERMVFDEEMKVIYHSDIIATTLGSCTQRRITKAFSEMSRAGDEKREVGVCIIDEATQATEADSLLPLVYDVKNFILVGDPNQLPPFVVSQTAKKFGLCQSLFARLYKVWNNIPSAPVYKLTAQHRMHPEIAKFPSKAFYDDQLTTPSFLAIKRPFKPYTIITHSLLQDSNETNLSEARLVVEIAGRLLLEPGMKGLSIGLIVPYQRQRTLIQELFVDKKLLKQLSVNTIDSYQGQERDVIIMSIVRTSGSGFLDEPQRLNVALTRARKAMYIIGNFTSLQTNDIWKQLLLDAKERNLCYDAGWGEKVDDIFGFLFERNKRSRTSNL